MWCQGNRSVPFRFGPILAVVQEVGEPSLGIHRGVKAHGFGFAQLSAGVVRLRSRQGNLCGHGRTPLVAEYFVIQSKIWKRFRSPALYSPGKQRGAEDWPRDSAKYVYMSEVKFSHENPQRIKAAVIGCGSHSQRNILPSFQY